MSVGKSVRTESRSGAVEGAWRIRTAVTWLGASYAYALRGARRLRGRVARALPPYRSTVRRATLLSCPRHGDLYLVVPGATGGDVLVAERMCPLRDDLPQPRAGERFGFCPLGDGEPVRYGPVPRNVGRWGPEEWKR